MTHEEILSMLGDYVDYLIANSSAEAPMWNIEKVRSGKPNKWNYIDGCMITACLSLYKTTGDEKYLKFSKDFIDWFVQEDGSIKTYDPKEYNLDNVNQGKNLFILYDIFGDEKYRKAIDTIRSQLLTQPRTREGNFWHKDIYPWQVWLDGTYMAQPFYMEYETRYNKMQGCIDSYKQFMNIKKHMRDGKTGLYYHGYDESRQMYWADPVTGCSPNFWLRAMGWFMVAMVDVLERMDEQLYNEYRGIMAMFKQTIEDVHKFQDEETGMFWQVMDHPGVEGNYLETSGTALFAYAVLKGVRLGYLPKRMAAWAEKAFYGTCDRYLSKNPDGSLQLDGICLVAGLGGKDHRDGSLAYYFSEPAYHRYVTTFLFIVYFGTMIYSALYLLTCLLFIRFPVLSPPCQNLIIFGHPSQMLAEAEEELATLPQLATEDMFITEHYFIMTSPYGNAIIPIHEILWIYKYSTLHKFLWYHFNISYTMHIIGNKHLYVHCPKNTKSDIDGIMDYLAEANHNILVGFSEENRLKVEAVQGKPLHIEKFYALLRRKV